MSTEVTSDLKGVRMDGTLWFVLLAVLSCLFALSAVAQVDVKTEAQGTSLSSGGEPPLGSANELSSLRSTAPSSLLTSRMHPAVVPAEAEARCSLQYGCLMGLSRGFAIGGDLLESLGVTTLGQHVLGSGAWHYVDVSGAYQILVDGPRKSSLNVAIGYRSYGYENSEEVRLARTGWTVKTTYAEAVYPAYTQGLIFEIHSAAMNSEGGAETLFDPDDPKRVGPAVKEFAQFSRTHPVLRLQLPADLEIANWSGDELDLNAPLRGFLRLTPTYEQADLRIGDVQNELYSWREKRFALGVLYLTSYVSPENKSGRFSALGGLGFEVGRSTVAIEPGKPTQGSNPTIPSAAVIRAKVEIQGTYQF